MENIKNKIQQIDKKYQHLILLFVTIIFFSTFIFSYDEEKIVVLCLISFATILYYNFNQIIFNSLQEESLLLRKELIALFSDKVIIMRKLRFSWRIFLDIEDYIVDMYCWVKRKFNKILLLKLQKRIIFFWNYLIKKDLNNLFQYKINISENFKHFLLIGLQKNYTQINFFKNTYLINLKNLSYNWTFKHYLLNKLNKNCINYNLQTNYNTYLYLTLFK